MPAVMPVVIDSWALDEKGVGEMGNGHEVKYRFEAGASFEEILNRHKGVSGELILGVPRLVEVTLFPDSARLGNDLGFAATFFAHGDLVAVERPSGRRPDVLSRAEFLDGYRWGNDKVQVRRDKARRTFELGSRSVSVACYQLEWGDDRYDVWATEQVPISPQAVELVASMLLGRRVEGVGMGLPLYVALHDRRHPDTLMMSWTAVDIKPVSTKQRPDPKGLPERRSLASIPRSGPRQAISLDESVAFARPRRVTVPPLPQPHRPRRRDHQPVRRRSTLYSAGMLMNYGRRVGFTIDQEHWDQLRDLANLFAGQYDEFDGVYDWGYRPEPEGGGGEEGEVSGKPGALRIDLDLWSQILPHLTLQGEELEVQKDLIAIAFILSGNTPVKSEERMFGLSPDEYARYEVLADVITRSTRNAGSTRWTIPADAEDDLAAQLIALLALTTHGLSDGNLAANSDLDDLTKRFALVVMLGAIQPATHPLIDFASAAFDETVIDYDDFYRGRLFIDAQVRDFLDQEIYIPHTTLETVTIDWVPWIADIGPILRMRVDSSTSLVESLTCQDDTFLAKIRIPSAEIVLHYQSRLRGSIDKVALMIATMGLAAFFEGTAEIQLDVSDIKLSVSASLPPVTDDDGSGLGLTYTLEDLDFTIDEMTPITWNEILKAAINEAGQTVLDDAEEQVSSDLGVGDPVTIEDDDGNPKKLIPWPDLLQAVDGPPLALVADGTFYERTLWATTTAPAAGPESGPSSVPHEQIPTLAYVFEHGFLTAWVNEMVSVEPAQWNITDVVGWAHAVGVELADLGGLQAYQTGPGGDYWPPPGYFLPGPSSSDELPDTPSCQNPPMVFPPSRYYDLTFTRYAPVVIPPPAGDSDEAGELYVRYDIALRKMERRQMLRVTVLGSSSTGPGPGPGSSGSSSSWGSSSGDQPDIEHDDEEYRHPQDDDADGSLPGFGGGSGGGGGGGSGSGESSEPECQWMVLPSNSSVSDMVLATVTVRARLLVGFTQANASFQKPLEAVLPSLGLAAIRDATGRVELTAEIDDLHTEEPFDSADGELLTDHLRQACEDDLRVWFDDAGFGDQPLSGVHYPSDSLGPFADPLTAALQNARLRQHGVTVSAGGTWDPQTHQFHYVSDGQGLLVWPITLDLDLASLFS